MSEEYSKSELRRLCRQIRDALPDRALLSLAACEKLVQTRWYDQADTVFCYLSVGSELNTGEILRRARRDGKRVCVPVCTGRGEMVAALPTGDTFKKNALNISEPSRFKVIPPSEIGLVVAPLTGFDETLSRLGQGGGYYDRFLPMCTNAIKVGIAFEAQKCPRIPIADHDIPLDAIITELNCYTSAS